MALGKRREERQEMWVATTSLPKSVGHVFYQKLNRLLAEADYHATDTIALAETVGVRTYIPERKIKGKRNWRDVPEEKRRAVINNRRRVRGARSKVTRRLPKRRRKFAEIRNCHVAEHLLRCT